MTTTLTFDELQSAQGTTVYSSDGEKIGSVEEIYVDDQTDRPEWIGLGTGFLGTKRALVPVEGASMREGGVLVPYGKDQVKGSPDIDSDEISQETEAQLYSHYGVGYSEQRSDTGLPEGAPAAAGEREGAVTRHEEELRVGKRDVETGRARLRKWVETEPVAEDVELRRETARVTREPVERSASAGEIGEEEIDVSLRAEEPVVQKETVAKERVGLEKDVETERETVGGEVRKERVDVEGDIER
jgi:uncharacterized protein (TIGR02271 family)